MDSQSTFTSPGAQRRADIAGFVVALYNYYVRLNDPTETGADDDDLPVAVEHIPPDLVADCHHAAKLLAQAVALRGALCPVSRPECYRRTAVSTSWDAEGLLAASNRAVIDDTDQLVRRAAKFPPLRSAAPLPEGTIHLPVIAQPCVFTDQKGDIMAWSLPEIIQQRRQVSFLVHAC